MTRAKRLFRYFPPEASDIVVEQKLWFSAARDFNDIFEVVPRYDQLLTDTLHQQFKRNFAFLDPSIPIDWLKYQKAMAPVYKRLIDESLETVPEGFQDKFSEHFGINCFCENGHSLLMWGHYTNCHHGFVVEFDPEHPLFSIKEFGKVEYSATRPFVEASEYWKIPLTKSPEWAYEQEHRLIKPLHELALGKRRDGKQKHFTPLPLDAIKGVYLGCRISLNVREELLNSLCCPEGKHIEKFIMRLHPINYELVPIPWDEWRAPAPDAVTDFTRLWRAIGL